MGRDPDRSPAAPDPHAVRGTLVARPEPVHRHVEGARRSDRPLAG